MYIFSHFISEVFMGNLSKLLTLVGVMEISEEFQAFFKTSEEAEFPLKWVPPEEQVKDGNVSPFFALPVGIGHGDLVEICEKRNKES